VEKEIEKCLNDAWKAKPRDQHQQHGQRHAGKKTVLKKEKGAKKIKEWRINETAADSNQGGRSRAEGHDDSEKECVANQSLARGQEIFNR
jgi:hypothetical protein